MKNGGAGSEFAWKHMETQGWRKGDGLGRKGQGITDALKPKLKFDQSGIGHSRAEEFEFHWWDHVFNTAAKGITVDESKGEVKVEFLSDKSEVSTKKLRRKMQKEIRNKLYSHFVKSGTLEGGKLVEDDTADTIEEVKDLSKIRTLTDEELLKACGGRTAHKGARHGQKMSAKLARVEEAEKKYMEEYLAKQAAEELKKQERLNPTQSKKHKSDSEPETVPLSSLNLDESKLKKKKKKKKNKDVEESLEDLPEKRKKKKKYKDLDSLKPPIDSVQPPIDCLEPPKKKSKKVTETKSEQIEPVQEEKIMKKKSKKKKHSDD